jgi:hypothetical protein
MLVIELLLFIISLSATFRLRHRYATTHISSFMFSRRWPPPLRHGRYVCTSLSFLSENTVLLRAGFPFIVFATSFRHDFAGFIFIFTPPASLLKLIAPGWMLFAACRRFFDFQPAADCISSGRRQAEMPPSIFAAAARFIFTLSPSLPPHYYFH